MKSVNKYPTQRIPLGQIDLISNNNKCGIIQTLCRKNYTKQTNLNLNENEMLRLKQLKNKYQKQNSENKSFNNTKKQNEVIKDPSFQKIFIQTKQKQNIGGEIYPKGDQNKNSSKKVFQKFDSYLQQKYSSKVLQDQTKSSRLTLYRQELNKKVEKIDEHIQSDLQKIQKKLKQFKQLRLREKQSNQITQFYKQKRNQKVQERNLIKFNTEKQNLNVQEQRNFSVRQKQKQRNRQKYQESQLKVDKEFYTMQLKNVNFIEEMKKKIQQIQSQKNINLSKKLSKLSQNQNKQSFINVEQQSFIVSNKPILQFQKQKITLAKLTPNLAQSQIIELTQRQKQKSDRYTQKQKESFVLKNYQFDNSDLFKNKSKKITNNQQIAQQVCQDLFSIKTSPMIQKNLQETQFIENCYLKGDFSHLEEEIEKEFILLINRISHQAQIDNRFGDMIYKYSNIKTSKGQMKEILSQKVRKFCSLRQQSFDQNIFQISQMEIDPLSAYKKKLIEYTDQQIQVISKKAAQQYLKINRYFSNKMNKKYSKETIQFFIQQLYKCQSLRANEQLNIGHLTSYINMRTGKNLRNRYFYKFLKRISNTNNQKLMLSSMLKKQDLIKCLVRQ